MRKLTLRDVFKGISTMLVTLIFFTYVGPIGFGSLSGALAFFAVLLSVCALCIFIDNDKVSNELLLIAAFLTLISLGS